MYQYLINVDKEMNDLLQDNSTKQNMGIEQYISQILKQFVVSSHILNEESMAKGYEEMGEINLELAK